MSPATRIHRLLRRLHQRNRLVGASGSSGVTLLHHHFLLELDADPEQSISSLGSLLGIDQGYGSRVCASLVEGGFLGADRDQTDSRRKRLRITGDGRKLVGVIDAAANERYARFSEPLSETEREDVTALFRTIADGFDHPQGAPRRGESAYRLEQRRITRCFGLLGERVFGSELSAASWQLLAETVGAPIPVTPSDLAFVMSLPATTVSSLVSRLVRGRLLTKRPSPDDRRSVELHPTARGRAVIASIEAHAVADLERALGSVPPKRLERWIGALAKFVGQTNPDEILLPPEITVRKVLTEDDRRRIRSVVTRAFVRRGLEERLPDRLASAEREVWEILRDDAPLAVVEAAAGKRAAHRSIVSELVLPGGSRAIAFAARERIRRREL